MKIKIITQNRHKSAFLLLLLLIGCMEEVPVSVEHRLAIYKTNKNYYNNVLIHLHDGKIYYTPDYDHVIISEGTITDTTRTRLVNGYVLDSYAGSNDAVLSYTIEEYYNILNVQKIIPSFEELEDQIIDRNPFTEFYIDNNDPPIFIMKDSALINQIIKNEELKLYFKKIKY